MGDESAPLLAGGAVQRVDVGPLAALIRVRVPGATRYVVIATGRGASIGVLEARPWKGGGLPGGAVSIGEKQRFRSKLEGGRVEGVGTVTAPRIVVRCGEERLVLEGAERITLRAIAEDDALGGIAATEEDLAALRAEGERLAVSLGEGVLEAERRDLGRALARAKVKIERRIKAIAGDLDRIGEAEGLAARASLFVAAAARAPRGATSIVVTDWSTGEAEEVTLALDPARGAREQIDAIFKRARRIKLGAVIGKQRRAEAERAREILGEATAALPGAISSEELRAIAARARAAAPKDFALAESAPGGRAGERGGGSGAGKAAHARSKPYREFVSAAGERILVGKGAANNDALTLHVARPHDLWLHAKGRAGAHVIVPLDKGHTCEQEELLDAAHLAAHFSEAREEGVVEIEHTARRYLRKPRGSAPGFVIVEREKVIVLRVERERIARLLAGEVV